MTANRVRTLSRGLQALEAVCRQAGGVTQSELARRLGVDRSTALRVLATLEEAGYVRRDAAGVYTPALKIAELASGILENLEIRQLAGGLLRSLTGETGLSSHLAVLSERRIVYVDGRHGPGMVRVNAGLGTAAPVHCSATGKALAAYLEPAAREELLAACLSGARRFPAHTSATITDPGLLEQEFKRVRRQGYAADHEEYEPGVRCLAAPIFGRDSRPLAVVGVSGTAARLDPSLLPEAARLVCRAADEISRRLGCPGPDRLREVE